MKRKVKKKTVSYFLLAAITAGMLCGCGKTAVSEEGGIVRTGTEEENSQAGENPGAEQDRFAVQGNGGTQAMGRYRETKLELPKETEHQSLVYFGWGEDGKLELYTAEREDSGTFKEAFRYTYADGTWQNDEEWQGNTLLKEYGLDFFSVIRGSDGFYYLGGTDEQYSYHLLKIREDGTAEELLREVFLPKEGQNYGLIPPKIEVLEDGNLVIYDYREVYLYTPLGKRLAVMGKDFTGSTSDDRGFCEGEEFVTVQGENLVRYDLQSGKVLETAGLDEIDGGREGMKLFGDGAGGVYVAGEKGLAHLNRGGTLWEILIDGSLNHMGMRSLYLRFFFAGEEQDYYGAFTANGEKEISIFHYTYDPDMLAVPPAAITVYSLNDHSTVRQAASQFQSEHPEVKVELRTAVEDGETVSEEVIQSLNTELLSGRGADVLILDGLPAQSYIEKGVLMDVRELIDEMEASGVLMNNLMEGFRQEDGAVYQVPARIEFILALGEEDAVKAYSSLDSMAGYSGEKPLFAADNYENLFRKTACLQYKELFIDGKITEKDGLVRYLETVKTLGEASGSKTAFTSESEMEEKWVSNNVRPDGIVGTSMNYDAGMCASGVERLSGYGDLCIPAQVRKQQPQSRMVPVGNLYFPSSMAGINQSTENAELAKEFIRCLISYEVQKEELYDGFPVNKDALDTLSDKESPGYMVGAGVGDGSYSIQAEWPDQEVRREVAAMMGELTIPILLDETVMKMIAEGSGDYFDGRENVQQAAEKILRKLSVYLAE